VGTDIGGSIRVPAAFNDCYGYRPTSLRNSTLGLAGINPGQESIRGIIGPLCQSTRDVQLFQQSLVDQEPWSMDTTLVPLPWRMAEPPKPLTIGIMWDDGKVCPHPPVTRALKSVAKRLSDNGMRVVDWKPYDHERGWEIVSALYFPDGGARYRSEFEKTGEPELPLTTWALSFARSKPLSVTDNWSLNYARETYRREYHAEMERQGVDVILCPSYVGASALQGGAKYWNYSAIWNILDQPALAMPSGIRCDQALDLRDEEYSPRNADDAKEWSACKSGRTS
jgi:amidase